MLRFTVKLNFHNFHSFILLMPKVCLLLPFLCMKVVQELAAYIQMLAVHGHLQTHGLQSAKYLIFILLNSFSWEYLPSLE